jgi:hypothetical protein
MDEVGIDRRQFRAAIERIDEMLAHAHQRRGAAGSEVEPPEQLLPPRFGGAMNFGGGRVRGLGPPLPDGGIEPRALDPEAFGKRLEERDARPRGQLGVSAENVACARGAGSFSAAREQRLAVVGERIRANLRPRAPLSRDQRAAAFHNPLQQLAEKRGIHAASLEHRPVNRYVAF